MKTGKTLVELATEVTRQNDSKQDYLVQSQALTISGANTIVVPDTGTFGATELAHKQIGEHLGIPYNFYKKLQGDFPTLLDQNVNTLMKARPVTEKRMVRTLDGKARAFLSDRYRRIDNYDVLETVLPVLQDIAGLQVASCEITDSRLYLKVTTPRVQAEVKKGDVVQAGLMLTNSEVGLGAYSSFPWSLRLVCLNGATHQEFGTRKYHAGARINGSEGEVYALYQDDTLQADDRALQLQIRDIVRGALSELTFMRIVNKMREAADAKIEGDPVKTVEVLARRNQLNDGERTSVLRNLVEGADLSLWGLANAVTATAGQVESYDRATELEALGGNIITLSRSEWRELSTVAA